LLQVDAFADEPFRGNPAAVCFLDGPRDDRWLRSVAAEMNLSETAFLENRGGSFGLRWFTPTVEVELCGHATLASAHAIWEEGIVDGPIRFATLSGELVAEREDNWIRLDFPAKVPTESPPPLDLLAALGVEPVLHAVVPGFHLVELDSAAGVRSLRPSLAALAPLGDVGVVVTAAGDAGYDFVSRVFAPGLGIDEDPVTGAAHCILAPFWTDRLGRKELTGYQASARGGVVRVRMPATAPGRVNLLGRAVTTLRGRLAV
jgi:predicted PhzF superfamily epimerase YddE/YHI9